VQAAQPPAADPAPLPAPAQRPQADVVIYDGACRFCQRQVRWLERLDRRKRLAFLSLHDPEVYRRWPDLSREQLLEAMVVVDHQQVRHAGAAAIRYLSRRLAPLWVICPWLHLPGSLPLWQWLYRFVARRRYWFGRTDRCDDGSCHLHAP
jgi:predicted DCC family thiol-disulfide oxidoreductase YuxK